MALAKENMRAAASAKLDPAHSQRRASKGLQLNEGVLPHFTEVSGT